MAKKISRTPKQTDTQPNDTIALLANADAQQNGAAPDADNPGMKAEVSIADLMKNIGELQARLDQQDRQSLAMMTPVATTQAPTPPGELDMTGLPPILDNPEGYAKELARRTLDHSRAVAKYEQDTRAVQQTNDQNYDELFKEFQEQHPEYANLPEERLKFASIEVFNDAKKRRYDINKYVFGQSPRFFADLTKKIDTIFGKPGEEKDDDDDTGRATSIFGGADASMRGRNTTPPEGTDMLTELRNVQRKSGFY